MKNIVNILTLSFLTLSLLSCQDESNLSLGDANLTVTVVRGTDRSKVIKNQNVYLYISQSDAEKKLNDIASVYSNESGKGQFNGLESGKTYWLRADNLIGKSIRDITVKSGDNHLELPLWR